MQPEDLWEIWHSLDGSRDVFQDRGVCHTDVDALWQLRRWGVVRTLLRFEGLRLRSFTRSFIIHQMRSLMLYRADQCIVHMNGNGNPPTADQPLDLLRPLPPQPQLSNCSSPHGAPRSCTRLLLKLFKVQNNSHLVSKASRTRPVSWSPCPCPSRPPSQWLQQQDPQPTHIVPQSK